MATSKYFSGFKSKRPLKTEDSVFFSGYSPQEEATPPPSQLIPGKPPSVIDRAKQYIRERTGLFEPRIEGRQFRETKPLRTIGGAGAHYGAEYLSGLGLNIPDILANKVSGADSLAKAVDKITGFEPTPDEIRMGEVTQFMGGLRTAGRVAGTLVRRVAARQALKNIAAGGIQFGLRESAEQLADKVVKDEPFDVEGIHFQSGVGTLFGAGAEGVKSLARFIKGVRSPKALALYDHPKGVKMTPKQHAAWSRKQSLSEIRKAQKAGGSEWERIKNKYMGLAGQPTAKPATPEPPTARGPIAVKAEGIYQNYINRFQSIENLSNRAKAVGLELPPGGDPKLLSRTYLGIAGKTQSLLENKTFRIASDGNIEITGEGLKPILDDYDAKAKAIEPSRKIRERDLDEYSNAQRTIHDLQRKAYPEAKRNIATEEQVAKAQETLTDLDMKYGDNINILEDAAVRRTGFRRRVAHLLVDSGNMSQKQFDEMMALNPHYTPFDRILEDFSGGEGQGKGFTKARNPLRRVKGSGLRIANTTESDIKNTHRIMEVAERNKVALSVANLMPVFPQEITPVAVSMRPIRVHPEEIKTTLHTFRSKAKPVIEEIRTTRAADGDVAGPMKKLEKVVVDALIHRGMTEPEAGNYLRKLKGQGLAAGATETLIERSVREVEKILTQELPEESTIFRPSQFMPKGRVIEYFDRGERKYMEVTPNLYDAMTGLTEEGLGLMTKLLSVPQRVLRTGATITPEFMARNPIRDQYTALLNANVGFVPFVDSAKAIADVIGQSESYHDWLRSGGSYAGFVELSRPALKKSARKLTSSRGRRVLRRMNILTNVEDLSQLLERGTRVGVSERAKKAGATDIEAAYLSREATTDFARRGSKMKGINSVVAFFNAGLQGTDRAIRAARADPLGFTLKGLATMTVPSVALYLHNRKDPEYFDLPRWRRDLFWNFKVGGDWWAWPKPFGYGQAFSTVPERFMEYADKRNPKSFDDLGKTLIESASPISGDPASGLLPTAIKPLLETQTNWNFFRQQPIVSEKKARLLPEEQYGRYTSETAKVLGKWFNYSPAKIDHLVRGYFGGSGKYALDATDILVEQIHQAEGKDVPKKRPRELADYPLLRGFVSRDPKRGSAQSFQDFYDDADRIESLYFTWREYVKTDRLDDAKQLLAQHPEIYLGKAMGKAKARLSEHMTAIDFLMRNKQIGDKERERRVRREEKARYDTVQEYNRLIRKAMR